MIIRFTDRIRNVHVHVHVLVSLLISCSMLLTAVSLTSFADFCDLSLAPLPLWGAANLSYNYEARELVVGHGNQ